MTPKGNSTVLQVIGGRPSPTRKANSSPIEASDPALASHRMTWAILCVFMPASSCAERRAQRRALAHPLERGAWDERGIHLT